jgi:DNA-binding beta-propeller fold protein YncE/endonuclease YncB( thermonuclease family)
MANMLILFYAAIIAFILFFPTFQRESHKVNSQSGTTNSKTALPSETVSEGIEISGPVNYVVDGDTLEINDIRIRLSLVNTPEVGETGFDSAKDFVENLCLDKNGQVDIDDGQRQGSFGREIGVVYCDGININSQLMSKGYALITSEFCDVSEFANEAWAKSSCLSNKSGQVNSAITSNEGNRPLSTKQGQQVENFVESESETDEQAASSSKSEKFVALDKWGSLGVSDGQFDSPSSIALDPSSQAIYVADLENDRIQKFDTNGEFLMKWGLSGTGDGEFYHPGDIETDSSGNVYVVDINNARVQKFDSEGNFLMKWGAPGVKNGQFNHPGDIMLDENNTAVYVSDIGNSRIQKFDDKGNFLMKWGSLGTGNGQCTRPAGMAFDSHDEIIYVADTKNDQIQKFDKNGNFLSKWGSSGGANGDFNRPTGVEYSSTDGIIYVTDNDNKRIQVFDKNGNFLSKWGSDKNFERPTGIAVDELNDKVFVNDKANHNIQVFSIPTLDPFSKLNSDATESNDNSEEEQEGSSGSNQDKNSKSKDEDNDSKDQDNDSKDEDNDSKDQDKEDCDDSYPDFCIPPPPPNLNCDDISEENFTVKGSDPHGFDGDNDGTGCDG